MNEKDELTRKLMDAAKEKGVQADEETIGTFAGDFLLLLDDTEKETQPLEKNRTVHG